MAQLSNPLAVTTRASCTTSPNPYELPMNVCVIAYTFYEIDQRVRRYAEVLTARGDRVDVIALRRDDQGSRGSVAKVNVRRIQRRSYAERRVFDYVVRILLFLIKGSAIVTIRHLKRHYDMIHVHNVPDFLVFMALLPRVLCGTRLILDIHDILPEFFAQKFDRGMKTLSARFLLFLEKISVRFADHVIVANDLWRDKIIARVGIPPEKCTTLLNYPDLEVFGKASHRSNGRSLTLIYPGTVSEHHGVDVAVRAVGIVRQQIPDVLLAIYVRSSNPASLDRVGALVSELGLEDNVQFYDPVPTERLSEIYSEADIGIVPKRGGIFADEAFSTKILEFMAAGIPVIASRTRIDEYYFDDSQILFFEPGDHEGLAQCVLEAAGNPSLRKSLAAAGKRYVAESNWERKKDLYYQIVATLHKSRGAYISPGVQLYRLLKPLLPRRMQIKLRSLRARYFKKLNRDTWPIDHSADQLTQPRRRWPHGRKFAFVLTHDVETARGLTRCRHLADLERELGMRSAFYLVPEGYSVPSALRQYLVTQGFEIGLHGFNHDGRLFINRKKFDERLPLINAYLKEWGSVGFRSPFMIHNLSWIGELEIEYDASTFDTDPLEPQPDGVRTIFPFVYTCEGDPPRSYVELPYTLFQDFNLFIILGEKDNRIWREKLDWIAEKGGMALLDTHPDYMHFGKGRKTVQEYPIELYMDFLEYVKSRYQDAYWNPLPRELAAYWRSRSSGPEKQ